jgi:hypothetical protein
LKAPNLIRVVAAALVLSTLSFAAGVAGDLSLADGPRSGARVVLRIPPELPVDAVRAAPLPLVTTASAAARPTLQPLRAERPNRAPRIEPIEKPPHEQSLPTLPKQDLDLAPKDEQRKGA